MNNLQIFKNAEFGNIRTVEKDGQPYFVASDIAKALGYRNTTDAIKQHCRWVAKHYIPHPQSENKTLEVNVIPEGDMYRLVTNSELPSAERFESWVFDEVLPSIRKHGAYMTPAKIEEVLLNPDVIINLATQLKQERELNEKLDFTVRSQEKQIEELKPLAAYVKTILNNKSLVTVEQIAQDYGMSAQKLNKTLHELHIQYKGGNGQWILYQEHKQFGYVHSETISFKRSDGRPDTTMHTKWTQKGRMFLYEELKEQGILPLIERDIEGKAI